MTNQKSNILDLVRPSLLLLKPYSSARDEFDSTSESETSGFVYLDANENPFPSAYNRYPDPHQKKLKKKISGVKGVPDTSIFLGNGSDEAIDLIIRIFCQPGKDNVIIPSPTYGMYKVSAEINDISIKDALLTDKFDVDARHTLSLVDKDTKIIFLCSPNNPSGNLLSEKPVIELLNTFRGMIVVDEAYIDFARSKSWTGRLKEFPHLIVLQTFSKAWGLAGLRLGLAFADPGIIQLLDRIKPPYNINSLTQRIALESLANKQVKNEWVLVIRKERERVASELVKIKDILRVYPSDANFLLVKISGAAQVYQKLISQKIVVRDRSQVVLCDECLRITIGTTDENDQLISSLKQP